MVAEPTGEPARVEAFDLRHHDDAATVVPRLSEWLAEQLGPDSAPRITTSEDDIANGMSSSMLLFDLEWNDEGVTRHDPLVARIAPDPNDIAVFPTYDLAMQFDTMRAVAKVGTVPVPEVRWLETSGNVIGHPFFVMNRIDGHVPPDMLPYTFGDNWLFDATDAQRSELEAAMVQVLANLHAIDDAPDRFSSLPPGDASNGYLARHLSRTRAWYDWSVADTGSRSPLVETALTQLTAELPDDPGETVLNWGDARIGNIIFEDHRPAAVLDWEMADLGPRELDVIWLAYSHRVFQDLAEGLDAPGLPDFLTINGVVTAYRAATGHELRDLDWHCKYAAVRWACAFLRTGARQAHMDGTTLTDDGDSLLHNRPTLTALVDGTFTY